MENNEKPLQVYGLIIEAGMISFLSVQLGSSLEEAFVLAKLEFDRVHPSRKGLIEPLLGVKIGLFTVKKKEELAEDYKLLTRRVDDMLEKEKTIPPQGIKEIIPSKEWKQASKEVEVKSEKNSLMKEIIRKKDKTMFEENIGIFTEAEKMYIKERLV